MKAKVVGWILLLLVVFVGGGIVLIYVVNAIHEQKVQQQITTRWEEFRKTALVAGTPLVDDAPKQDMDYSAEASRLLAIYNNRTITFDNPELSTAWTQIETNTSAGMQILNRIGFIDQNKPSGYQILANALQNDPQANQQASNEVLARLMSEFDKANLEQQFRQTEGNLDASIGALGQVGDSLTHDDLPGALSVQYLPSWDGTYWGDLLAATNTSGKALQNAVVMATVRMSDGTSKVHAHYVDQWNPGATLQALYRYGSTDYAASQTGDHPQSVEVAVYVRDGEARSTYALTPQEWEKRVQGYSSASAFTGHYLASYSDTNGTYPAGFEVQYQGGLPTLPVTSLEVRFSSDASSATPSYVWTPNGRLVAGTAYALREDSLNGDTPGHIDLTVHFAETDYTQQVHVY